MKRFMIIAALVFSFAADVLAQDADSLYAKELLRPGTEAPDFKIKDMGGKEHSLGSFKGSYVVLDFWASWCPDCRKDVPLLKELHGKYGGKRIKFVSVSFDDKKENWERYVNANGMNWLQLSELKKMKEADVSKSYKVRWIPTMYLIDRDGQIILSTVMIEKLAAKLKELHEL